MAQRLSQVANDLLQEKLGYRFLGIDLTELLPPEELSDALNAVMRVELEAEADYARAESDARQRELSARRSVQIASKKADAVAAEIRTLAGYLERLAEREVLRDYVARRRTEVLAESKTLFVRGAS